MLSELRTPLYRNTGSVARDHLASERTFLAWMRTGLGFIALGIAIERFSQLDLAELLPHLKPDNHASTEASVTSAPTSRLQARGRRDYKAQSQVIVGTLLGTGSGSIVYGTSRYFVNLRLLEQGFFKPAYHGPAVLSIVVAGLAGGVYYSTIKSKEDHERA